MVTDVVTCTKNIYGFDQKFEKSKTYDHVGKLITLNLFKEIDYNYYRVTE